MRRAISSRRRCSGILRRTTWSHIATSQVAGSSPPVTGQPKNFTESIPTISFDTGLVFDRSVRLFGQDYIQTLEPRLYYVYTPYHNQDFAPIFDTAEADFGLAEIYTPNTFVGNDRIADANRLTAGLTTRFINPATGDERARFVIAQQYYFRASASRSRRARSRARRSIRT